MIAGFEKVKTEYKRRALIYSAAGGVLFGLAVTGILLIALKLSAIVLGWYLYLVICVAAAAVCAAVLWLILKPNDIKLARKLDKTYSLDEQTQTRVEFAGNGGAVVELQRQTADVALDSLPKRRPSWLTILLQVVAVVVALALFISGIVVPQKHAEVIEEPPYTVDATKLELLQQLIDDVQGDSVMESGVQASYVQELGTLLENLNSDDLSDTKVTDYVHDSMYNISDITIEANTYDDIARVLSGSNISGVEYIAEAIRSSAKASGADGANIDLSSYSNLGTAAQDKISTLVVNYMSDMGDTLKAAIEGLTDDTVLDTLAPYISAFEAVLTDDSLVTCYDALITNGGLTFGAQRTGRASSGDDFYDEFYDLYYIINTAYTAFYNYANGITGGTIFTSAANVQYYIINNGTETNSNNVYAFVRDGGTALQAQAYTYLADAYIRYTLGSIFSVTVVGNTVDDGDTDSSSGGDDDSSGGGGGTGETLYPGDDIIYNPDTGEYSYYYEMLNDSYLSLLYSLLYDDEYDGLISDEVKSFILSYINELL